MSKIDLYTARQIILQSQLLATDNRLLGKEGTLQAIKQLGYVQIDTISVVERAHHHVLWTRVPDYEPNFLQTLDIQDRAIFDYWSHAASYLPIEDYRYSLVRKKNMDNGSGFWRLTDPVLSAHVLERIRKKGPLMARDFEKEKTTVDQAWMIPAINQVIRQLFMKGELMVAGRKGIQKIYDLPERVLPPETSSVMPSTGEYVEYIIRRNLLAHGLVRLGEFGYLLKVPKKEFQAVLKKMIQSGEVVEVDINGLSTGSYFAFRKTIDNFSPTPKKLFHILSPFDNLIIQRKRLAELFDFQYTLECYVPAAKRKFGYFGLPLLYGTQFVGQMDAKADRKTKILYIRNLEWNGKTSQVMLKAFEKKLWAFAQYCGCQSIENQSGL
ncbi:MAG: hypothetical protein DHS20C18_15750 [Saprospiraceae bacterium]|nr:MAG: hypothetical protein DHS20C18_15750 [Saprospiraceae bacterium]